MGLGSSVYRSDIRVTYRNGRQGTYRRSRCQHIIYLYIHLNNKYSVCCRLVSFTLILNLWHKFHKL